MTKKQSFYRIIISLGVNLAIAFVAIFAFGTKLYMDDDSILSWMTYGIITEASSRTYYTNVILGWLYKHLFSLIPEFNWQTLIYYLGMTFSGTVGLYAVLKKKEKILTILWFLFVIVFFYDVYICLTFSVVAAYAAYQGYLALFLFINEKDTRILEYIVSGVPIIFSSMVRIDSFLGASGFAFILWVIFVVLEYKKNHDMSTLIKKYVYPFVVILGIGFLLFGVDRASYLKGSWKEYKEYEAVRLVLTDYRNSVSLMRFDELEKLGINPSTTRAVAEWRNNDPEILTKETLEIMATTNKDYNHIASKYVWMDFLEQFKRIFTKYAEVYFTVLLFAFLMCIFTYNKEKRCIPLLLLLPILGELFYFAFVGRIDGGGIPERCVYIILMGLSVSEIILCTIFDLEESDILFKRCFLVAMVVSVLIAQTTKGYSVDGLGLVDTDAIEDEYGFLGNTDKVYICEYDVRQRLEEAYGAWQTPPPGFMDRAVVIGSWLVKHPMQNELQEALGCANPYRALFERDNVYYIRDTNSEELVLEYLHENYDEGIEMEYSGKKGDFKVFKYYLR